MCLEYDVLKVWCRDCIEQSIFKYMRNTDTHIISLSFHIFNSLLCPPISPLYPFSTIPIAKRRYYGRVQEAVHEFLLMGPAVVKGDMTDPTVQDFFDVEKTVIVEAKRQDVNGQCTKKDGNCKGKEIRDSRYNDMKASMYLLGNAFRINQTKAPDNLPTVQAAKKFFKVMDAMEKQVAKKPKTNDAKAQQLYLDALDILDTYLDLVELPPTDSGNYDKEFDTLVGATARIM